MCCCQRSARWQQIKVFGEIYKDMKRDEPQQEPEQEQDNGKKQDADAEFQEKKRK
jgi:hypothetical protein